VGDRSAPALSAAVAGDRPDLLELTRWCVGWGCAWLATFAVFHTLLIPAGFGGFGTSWVAGLWYAVAAAGGLALYRREWAGLDRAWPGPAPALAALGSVGLVVATYGATHSVWPLDAAAWAELERHQLALARFDGVYLVYKLPELCFQQALILMLTLRLQRSGLSGWRLIGGFALVFGGIHLPLLAVKGLVAVPFIVAATGAAALFPLLIARFRWGVAYSFSVHLLAYLVAGLALRSSLAAG
jgi:hypothetical protein